MRRVARWGSIGEYLELAFFGEAASSLSMASGTGLLDQEALRWDAEALAAAGIEPDQLFPIEAGGDGRRGLRAPWASRWPALRSVPWYPAVGDGAAGSLGSDCTDPGRIALNVGTSAALRVVTDAGPRRRAGSGATGSTAAARCSAAPPPRAATSTRGAARSSACPTTTPSRRRC